MGAVGALFIVYAPTLAALEALAVASPLGAALSLLAGEAAARSAMLLLLVFGRPAGASSSACFVSSLRKGSRRAAALILAPTLPPLVALPLGPGALLVALVAPAITAIAALALANRAFGGISGDVAGATGELARAVLLVVLSGLLF